MQGGALKFDCHHRTDIKVDAELEMCSAEHMPRLSCIEICAGGGGQAIGIESAGFEAQALVELDHHACATLRANRPHWNVVGKDVREFSAIHHRGIDLLAGGGFRALRFPSLENNWERTMSGIYFPRRYV